MSLIGVSLAAAPLVCLSQVVRELEAGRADMLHFDLEDGVFLPAMTLGTRIIGELRSHTSLPFETHLMVQNPERIIPEVVALGGNRVSVHFEACAYPRRTLRLIRDQGALAGLAFNPRTALPDLRYLTSYLDYVLILTSEPECPAADFLPEILYKVDEGREMIGRAVLDWEVDGGITPHNAGEAIAAGVTTIVAGRSVFKDKAIVENLTALRAAMGG
jgi:ribulose-phosphate 3-epimerase